MLDLSAMTPRLFPHSSLSDPITVGNERAPGLLERQVLQEFSDSDIQELYKAGGIAYRHSVGTKETPFDKDIAFTEAAGEYVEDRISRWCTALYGLAKVLQDPKTFQWKLTLHPTIVEEYDRPLSVFGIVDGEEIASPKLSDPECQALRAAIDKKLLDGRPLTKPFKDTPLADLHDAAKKKAGL